MEQTEQKHSKKQTSCRDQRQKSQNDKTTRTKNLFFEKAPTKVRYSRSTKKEEKQLSRGRRKLSLPPPLLVVSSFRTKARAPKAAKVCF